MAKCTAERLNDIMGYEMVYLNVAIVQYTTRWNHAVARELAIDHICIECHKLTSFTQSW